MPSATPTLLTTPAGPALSSLTVGTLLTPNPDAGGSVPRVRNARWRIPSGLYTPQQIVASCAPLLEAVLHHLGPDPANSATPAARKLLIDNLASNLKTDTRESSLQLPPAHTLDAGKREMHAQALRVGAAIVGWAREVAEDEAKQAQVQLEPKLDIRSPCEGHLLFPVVAQLMFGPRSKRHLMQLYNEWLHQMVLLRDALLPWENYGDVLIRIDEGEGLGMRFVEDARERFLTVLLTKVLTQKAVVGFARAVAGVPERKRGESVGYGWQDANGVALPAFLAGDSSLRLLHYFPARVVGEKEVVTFDYATQDYYSAPRIEPSEAPEKTANIPTNGWRDVVSAAVSTAPRIAEAFLEPTESSTSGTTALNLVLSFDDGRTAAVDVGQISRGRRYSYRASDSSAGKQSFKTDSTTSDVFSGESLSIHDAVELLSKQPADGLVSAAQGGLHVVPVRDQLVGLALLGKIYPENTVLLGEGQKANDAEAAGKSFATEAKFVIVGEAWSAIPGRRGAGGSA